MPYQYAMERGDYRNLASGRVLYGLSGTPTFPVRLASELWQRCLVQNRKGQAGKPCTLYDPCCGSGHMLTTLAYMHWETIGAIIGSDVNPEAISLGERNMALLTREGMDYRIGQIEHMHRSYGKASHKEALISARQLKDDLIQHIQDHTISSSLFVADATDSSELGAHLPQAAIDIVITDVPYGQHSAWQGPHTQAEAKHDPLWQMLDALYDMLTPHTIVGIASDKGQTAQHENYQRLDRFQIGKRRLAILGRL